MQKTLVRRSEIRLVGISVNTSYQQEADKMKGHIFPCVKKYFDETLYERISNRKKPGTTFCTYTNYESDYRGMFTYFIGEEVLSFDFLPEGFEKLVIPEQKYVRFTTLSAPMPDVLENSWDRIRKMSTDELGGKLNYHTDFEIYDERASDHQNIILDIYVGLQS